MYFPQTKCQETCLQKPNCIHRLSLSLTLYSSLDKPRQARPGEGRAQPRRGSDTREASSDLGGPGQCGDRRGRGHATSYSGARHRQQQPARSRTPPGPGRPTADRLCNFTILPQNLDRVPIKDKENSRSKEKR